MQRGGRGGWLTAARKQKSGTESPWWGRNGWTPALQALEHPWIWTVFHFPNYISISMKLISHSYSWVPWNSRCSLFNVYPYNNSTIIWGNQKKTFHMIKGSQRLQWCYDPGPSKKLSSVITSVVTALPFQRCPLVSCFPGSFPAGVPFLWARR